MADDIITVSLVMVRLVLFVNRLAAASVADHPVSLHFEIPLFDGLHIIYFFFFVPYKKSSASVMPPTLSSMSDVLPPSR